MGWIESRHWWCFNESCKYSQVEVPSVVFFSQRLWVGMRSWWTKIAILFEMVMKGEKCTKCECGVLVFTNDSLYAEFINLQHSQLYDDVKREMEWDLCDWLHSPGKHGDKTQHRKLWRLTQWLVTKLTLGTYMGFTDNHLSHLHLSLCMCIPSTFCTKTEKNLSVVQSKHSIASMAWRCRGCVHDLWRRFLSLIYNWKKHEMLREEKRN